MVAQGTGASRKGKRDRDIRITSWNIENGRKENIQSACRALDSLGVDIGFLQETKLTDDTFTPQFSQCGGYKISATNAPSKHQGGVAFCWRKKSNMFIVKEEKKWHPNVMTIHVVTRKIRYYIVGCYLPPDDLETLEYVKKAWEQRPTDATPLLMGDINVDLDNPESERDDIITE